MSERTPNGHDEVDSSNPITYALMIFVPVLVGLAALALILLLYVVSGGD